MNIFTIVNKLPKRLRVYLKNGILHQQLNRYLAKQTSQKLVLLSAEKMRNMFSNGAIGRDKTLIDNIIAYKKDALRHFQFMSNSSDFQKGVVHPLLVKLILFLVSFIAGIIVENFLGII